MKELTTKATETKTQAAMGDRPSQRRQKWLPTESEIESLFVSEFRDNDPRCAILVRQIIETHRAKNNAERKKIVDAIKAGNEWQRIAATWEKFCRRALARSTFSQGDANRNNPGQEATPEPVSTKSACGEQRDPAGDGTTANFVLDGEEVALADIDLDCAIRVREKINQEVVERYCELMKAGANLPPIKVFRVDSVLKVADGQHRCRAAEKAGFDRIRAIVVEGTQQDALRAALGANAQHGLPRSNKDKRRVAMLGIENFGHLSDREIASICQVSNTFIGEIRAELSTADSSERRTGKDGKARRLPNRKKASEEGSDKPKNEDSSPSSSPSSSENEDEESTGSTVPQNRDPEPSKREAQDDANSNDAASEIPEESAKSPVDALWQWLISALEAKVASLSRGQREELAVRLVAYADDYLYSKARTN